MSFFWKQCMYFQYAVWFLSSTVYGIARFTNPKGPDGSTSLTIGEQFLIVWQDADTDYSLLSLGVRAAADGNIFWLISNDENYPTQNYLYTVALGNGITLSQGNVFNFVLVNGTNFGLYAESFTFTIKQASSSTTSSTSSTISTSSTSSTSSIAAATTTNAAPTAAATLAQPANDTSSSGMSTGAKIGVGVGVPIVVIAVIVAVFLLFRRRRKAKAAETHYSMSPNGQEEPKFIYSGAVEAPTPYNQEPVVHEAPNGKNHMVHEAP